jgi:hypothetical protein
MHTSPSHGRPVEPATPAAPAAGLRDPEPEAGRSTRLVLTVWRGHAGRWRARVQLADGETHVFDSPFELARFVTQLTDRRLPPADPVAGGGLR